MQPMGSVPLRSWVARVASWEQPGTTSRSLRLPFPPGSRINPTPYTDVLDGTISEKQIGTQKELIPPCSDGMSSKPIDLPWKGV